MRWALLALASAAAASLPSCASASAVYSDVCALPPSHLFLPTGGDRRAPRSCDDNGALSSNCSAACSCRRLVRGSPASPAIALCVSASSAAACSATDCRASSAPMALSVGLDASDADASPPELAAEGGGSKPSVWVWVAVGVGVLLLLALGVFLLNWCRHRPRKGDNRTEVAEAERAVQRRKEARRASAGTAATRTRETNASVISGELGESYHAAIPGLAQTSPSGPRPSQPRYGSPLVGTELAVSLHPTQRLFSPISDESKDSSEYSQGVEDDGLGNRAPLVRRALADSSDVSDLDSFSSGITIEDDESTRSGPPYPRKKSIEF